MRVRAREDCHRELPDGRTNPSITAGKQYVVVGISLDDYRLVNDRDEPVLFPTILFDVIVSHRPADWVRVTDEDGGVYLDPPACAAPGFYERWHDGDPIARRIFAEVYAALLADDARRSA